MKKIISKTAFSLLELIIASVLVLIVIMGIFAINSVLSNNNQDYGQRYFVKSETQTTLNHILNSASLAIGSGTKDSFGNLDIGIQIGTGNASTGDPGVSDVNSFCIHQDISSGAALDSTTANSPPTTPPNYTGSRWLCYTWYPSSINCPASSPTCAYQIFYCAFNFSPAASYPSSRGAASCVNAPLLGPTYLGTVSSNPAASASFTSTAGFSITLNNCLDNTQASGTCGTTNNPQQTVSGSVLPPQVGAQQN